MLPLVGIALLSIVASSDTPAPVANGSALEDCTMESFAFIVACNPTFEQGEEACETCFGNIKTTDNCQMKPEDGEEAKTLHEAADEMLQACGAANCMKIMEECKADCEVENALTDALKKANCTGAEQVENMTCSMEKLADPSCAVYADLAKENDKKSMDDMKNQLDCLKWAKDSGSSGPCGATLEMKGEAAMGPMSMCAAVESYKEDGQVCLGSIEDKEKEEGESDEDYNPCGMLNMVCMFSQYDGAVDYTDLEKAGMSVATEMYGDESKQEAYFKCLDENASEYDMPKCKEEIPKMKLTFRPKITAADASYIGAASVAMYADLATCQLGTSPIMTMEQRFGVPKSTSACTNFERYEDGAIQKTSTMVTCKDAATNTIQKQDYKAQGCSGDVDGDADEIALNTCFQGDDGGYQKITWKDGFCGGEDVSSEIPADKLEFKDFQFDKTEGSKDSADDADTSAGMMATPLAVAMVMGAYLLF